MLRLLSGNEALALGAYHSGVKVAAAYPGTPSTEILETLARFKDIHAEWSTNEKVAMEVGLGAAYAGVRVVVSMKHVGLNVAMDAFMAASTTGVRGGLVVVSADDPGVHSSQNEQDNRHYARFAKVPMIEPADSQEAYDLMADAFDISEKYDTPCLVRMTTRVSHSKSVVNVSENRTVAPRPAAFGHDIPKYVMLPVYARLRLPLLEQRMTGLSEYSEQFAFNRIVPGNRRLGIVASGVAYQYAREVFPDASFLKLTMTYPLPEKLVRKFAGIVDRILVIEELNPFLEDSLRVMGIRVSGKDFIPRFGELSPEAIEEAAHKAGLLEARASVHVSLPALPKRPPLLCPGCPHTGIFFVLSTIGRRSRVLDAEGRSEKGSGLIITGDIGCYTLATYPPLRALDTCGCMGASIGQAQGIWQAGTDRKVVAVIGDSTFLHSGITGLINAIYNRARITVIILDNSTTAMTGHQEHPGTGVTAQGEKTAVVDIAALVRGLGIADVHVLDAFKLKELRAGVRSALNSQELNVIVVRGACSVRAGRAGSARVINAADCDLCLTCLTLGCPAIRYEDSRVYIDSALCAGEACTICQQVCPHKAISAAGTK